MEDSPVLGLMTDNKKAKRGTKEKEETQNHDAPSEAEIKEAIRKRASHLKENSGSITGAGVRRLLEEDLKLEKFALDAFKKFISDQVTEVFSAPEISKKTSGDGMTKPKKSSHVKASNNSTKEEHSGSSENESEESEESGVKGRKRTAPKGKVQGSAGFKRKRAEVEKNDSKRKSKVSKTKSGENSDKDADDVSVSDDNSESSAEKTVQKKEVAKPSYGKRVEHLKTIIKSCGMSVPPSVYKKVKQAPENKREATLIKELEDLLQKEGLSSNPSEKEIKEVKKRKDRAKELEGIDMSNIVFSSRRRSTSSLPPPKPKSPVKNDKNSSNDDDDGEEEDDDGNEDDNEEDNDEDDNDDEEVGEEEEEEGDEGQDNDEDDDENDDEDGQSEEDED